MKDLQKEWLQERVRERVRERFVGGILTDEEVGKKEFVGKEKSRRRYYVIEKRGAP